jgi:hypothetical protein
VLILREGLAIISRLPAFAKKRAECAPWKKSAPSHQFLSAEFAFLPAAFEAFTKRLISTAMPIIASQTTGYGQLFRTMSAH